MADLELCYMSAAEALRRFRDRSLSPLELLRALIARAEAVEPKINAFTATYFEEALDKARLAEARYAGGKASPRALEGLAVAIKDETPLKGRRTTQGSLLLKDHVDERTNPSAERILRAGAIVHARTTTPEFCVVPITWSRLWGVSRTPWNLAYSPGGSSGGSAASLAAGSSTLANGSDIGGSIRIPASACGVVGFKPPYGRNPDTPPFSLDWYNHIGPLARTVADCAIFQNVMAGPHLSDIATVRPKLRIPPVLPEARGRRVALSIDLDVFEVDAEVERNTRETADALRSAGVEVEEVRLGWPETIKQALWWHWGAYLGPYIRRYAAMGPELVTDYVREFLDRTRASTVEDFFRSVELETELYENLGKLFAKYDALICPTLAVPSVAADHDVADRDFRINGKPVDAYLDWCLTYPFNMMSRCPVLSVPSGFAANGVPTGIQIVGRPFQDVSVFELGAALERVKPWLDVTERRPAI